MKRIALLAIIASAMLYMTALAKQFENEGRAKGKSCYEIGYRSARCSYEVLSHGLDYDCDPEDNLIRPDRCSYDDCVKGVEAFLREIEKSGRKP